MLYCGIPQVHRKGGILLKKVIFALMMALVLWGCSGSNEGFDRAMALRTSLLNGQGCQFEAKISADFGDRTYTFLMDCMSDGEGNLHFTVKEPMYIEGITGTIQAQGGKLTFDDTALAFPLMAEGISSPVSGPWILITALRSGYVRYCGEEDGLFRMTVDDSFQENALTLDIWLSVEQGPVQADIYEENRRIMGIEIKNFQIR